MKWLIILMFFLISCGGLGGDGDGNLTASCETGQRRSARGDCIIVQNSPENVEDIILGNNQDDILSLTTCCKSCLNNPVDGIEDSECIAECQEKFNADTLNVFIEECRFSQFS